MGIEDAKHVSKKMQRTWKLIGLERVKSAKELTKAEEKRLSSNIRDILKYRY